MNARDFFVFFFFAPVQNAVYRVTESLSAGLLITGGALTVARSVLATSN